MSARVPKRARLAPQFRDDESWKHPILQGLRTALAACSPGECELRGQGALKFKRMHELYPTYRWQEILSHPAMVLIPYQVSTMSFFELYRMNMPLFVPSLRLLCAWVREPPPRKIFRAAR